MWIRRRINPTSSLTSASAFPPLSSWCHGGRDRNIPLYSRSVCVLGLGFVLCCEMRNILVPRPCSSLHRLSEGHWTQNRHQTSAVSLQSSQKPPTPHRLMRHFKLHPPHRTLIRWMEPILESIGTHRARLFWIGAPTEQVLW